MRCTIHSAAICSVGAPSSSAMRRMMPWMSSGSLAHSSGIRACMLSTLRLTAPSRFPRSNRSATASKIGSSAEADSSSLASTLGGEP